MTVKDNLSEDGNDSYFIESLNHNPIIKSLIEHAPLFVGVLNTDRQFVIANYEYLKQYNIPDITAVLGQKPGDVFSCREIENNPDGCGRGINCRHCSLAKPLLKALESGVKQVSEARIAVKNGDLLSSLDLKVTAEPVRFGGKDYLLFFLQNISDKKRLERMEYVFFHDILNSVSSSSSLLRLLEMDNFNDEAMKEYFPLLKISIADVIEQIQYHQHFKRAENGEYEVRPVEIAMDELTGQIFQSLELKNRINEIVIRSELSMEPLRVLSDRILLSRVIHNMIKNAFEACQSGDRIRLKLYRKGAFGYLEVANPQVMTGFVKSQIFHRSFSTKGTNRGLGTFSMKYITTQLLDGDVTFISDKESGTVFTLRIPCNT